MRNKYTKDFDNFIRENVSKYTKEKLRQVIQSKYNVQMTEEAVRRYLNRHNIKDRPIDYRKYNVRNVYTCPIGTERATKEGVFIKVAQPDKWRRKSRVMYEKYHNCKLKDDEYIVFLNHNNNDFSKQNLIKSTQKEIAYLHNYKTFSTDPELTKLGLLSAKLIIKTKQLKENAN